MGGTNGSNAAGALVGWAETPDPEPRIAASTQRRSRRPVLDVAFALLTVSTIAYFVRETRNFWFRTDDWALAFRGGSFGDYFEPYNDHLAIVHIAIYKTLYEIFGFGTYLPLRGVAIGTIAAIAVAMYLLFRARVGAAIALVAGTSLLWYPQLQLSVPSFPLFLPVVAAIACAWILPKSRPAHDIALGVVVTLAVCTSGTGAPIAAGCLVYLACTRARLWRWVAVIVPSAAWALWWLTKTETGSRQRPVTEVTDPILTGIRNSFAGLTFGKVGLGTILALAFVALLAWRLRRGPRACANELAWSAALVFWWAGLAISRPGSFDDIFRYEFVGSAFVLLAFLPTKSTNLPARLDWRALAAASILAAAVIVVVNKPGIDDTTLVFTNDNRLIRQGLIVANQGPEVVPDEVSIYIGAYQPLTAGEYRSAVARYGGAPDGTDPRNPDAALVRIARLYPRVVADPPPPTQCEPLTAPATVPASANLTLRAGDEDVDVEVQRFSPEPTAIGPIGAGEVATLSLPGLGSLTGWIIDAPGACIDFGTTIQMPRHNRRLQRDTTLVALQHTSTPVSSVEFHLTGGDLDDELLGTGRPSYIGYRLTWDTTAVPNGRYLLTAKATSADGNTAVSEPVAVLVAN